MEVLHDHQNWIKCICYSVNTTIWSFNGLFILYHLSWSDKVFSEWTRLMKFGKIWNFPTHLQLEAYLIEQGDLTIIEFFANLLLVLSLIGHGRFRWRNSWPPPQQGGGESDFSWRPLLACRSANEFQIYRKKRRKDGSCGGVALKEEGLAAALQVRKTEPRRCWT